MSLRKFCEITEATAKNQSLQDKPLSEIPPKQHNSVIGLTKLLFFSGSVENPIKIVKLSFSDYTRKALFQMDKYTKHWNEKVGDFINSRSQNIKQDKQKGDRTSRLKSAPLCSIPNPLWTLTKITRMDWLVIWSHTSMSFLRKTSTFMLV